MVTTASKFFFAAALLAFVASWVYGLGTDGEVIGVVFLGFKGAVGELAGYTVLQVLGAVLLALGATSSVLRDADPEVQAAAARLESLPPATAPTRTSYWPVLGALGAVVAAVGLVASPVLFVIGLLGVLIVLLEWMVSAWSERATGDPSVNRKIRNRLMFPIEVPLAAALGILVLVVSISRVLLTVSKAGSSVVAMVVASTILGIGFLFAYRPKVGKDVVAGIVTVFALAVIVGGVVGAASGTREFEPHEAEHTDEDLAGSEGSDDQTDAGGGPDAGAEEDPEANDPGNDGAEDTSESPTGDGDTDDADNGEPVAEGTDEDVVGDGDPEVSDEEDPELDADAEAGEG